MEFEEYPDSPFRYLMRADVIKAVADIDIVDSVQSALVLHGKGQSILPEEAYLGWLAPDGAAARCLAMPGALLTDKETVVGLKTINASLSNPNRGIPRSQGFTILLDPETARPRAVLEAAYISAMRTAAVTAIGVRHLAVDSPRVLALLGCGPLARAHANLLLDNFATLRRVVVYDIERTRAEAMLQFISSIPGSAGLDLRIAGGARECVADADVVVPVTTVTEGYLEPDWLAPGAFVAHVSLDDLTERSVLEADLLVVDDWNLVRDDPRRLLGRMYRQGTLLGPDGTGRPGVPAQPSARRVDTTLDAVVSGDHPGRRRDADVVVSNPFGMSILDVAVAHDVLARAEARGIGTLLRA